MMPTGLRGILAPNAGEGLSASVDDWRFLTGASDDLFLDTSTGAGVPAWADISAPALGLKATAAAASAPVEDIGSEAATAPGIVSDAGDHFQTLFGLGESWSPTTDTVAASNTGHSVMAALDAPGTLPGIVVPTTALEATSAVDAPGIVPGIVMPTAADAAIFHVLGIVNPGMSFDTLGMSPVVTGTAAVGASAVSGVAGVDTAGLEGILGTAGDPEPALPPVPVTPDENAHYIHLLNTAAAADMWVWI